MCAMCGCGKKKGQPGFGKGPKKKADKKSDKKADKKADKKDEKMPAFLKKTEKKK